MDWISVKDRLPEPTVEVLAFHSPDRVIDFSWVYGDGSWAFERSRGLVTHWMPLPAPPREGNDNASVR